jgi:hypothetical protein
VLGLQDFLLGGEHMGMINFVQRCAQPGDAIGSCIHAGGRQNNLSSARCGVSLSNIVEEAGADRNVVGSFLVSRVVFFRTLVPIRNSRNSHEKS